MKISAKTDYACRALLELSLHWPNTSPIHIDVIAKNQGIPIKFLTQILLNLKQLGYVTSMRGKSGGYLLARAPREITVSDVIIGLGGAGLIDADATRNGNNAVMSAVWQEIEEELLATMNKINFEIIRERSRSGEYVMMFGI